MKKQNLGHDACFVLPQLANLHMSLFVQTENLSISMPREPSLQSPLLSGGAVVAAAAAAPVGGGPAAL